MVRFRPPFVRSAMAFWSLDWGCIAPSKGTPSRPPLGRSAITFRNLFRVCAAPSKALFFQHPSRTPRRDALRPRPKFFLPTQSFTLRDGIYRTDSRHLTLSKDSFSDYISHTPQWPVRVYMGDVSLCPKVRFSEPPSRTLYNGL